MESSDDVHRSMTVEDGSIRAFDEEPAGAWGEKTVDLGGVHVFPALIDAHLHMLDTIGLSALGFEICRIENGRVEPRDLVGVGERIAEFAAARRSDAPIICSNYIVDGIAEGRLPNRFELDEWTAGASILLMNIDGHSSSCSTAMLESTDLSDLASDGVFTGALHDAHIGEITAGISAQITPMMLGDGIADFCNTCASFGIGTVCALEGMDDLERDRLTELVAFFAQRMPLDVRLFPQYMDERKLARVVKRMGRKRVGGCSKWELDGSVGSRTAAFARPYNDGRQGSCYFEDDVLRGRIAGFAARDYMVSAHAIGEEAIAQLVGIYEQVGGRHRIDHCEFPAPDVLPRLYALRPFVTVQPGYSWVDKRYLHGYERALDAARIAQQVPLRDLAAHGVTLCGSSDSPVQTIDPYLQMRGMREFYLPEQSLSAFEALKTYTVNGGLMLGECKGLLRVGYEASFFTTGVDLLSAAPDALEGMRAENLYLRGVCYEPHSGGIAMISHLMRSRSRSI